MQKALEILKKERQIVTHLDGISLDEAITELEALQALKSCDNCKWFDDCAVFDLLQSEFGFEKEGAYCHEFEPKDQK